MHAVQDASRPRLLVCHDYKVLLVIFFDCVLDSKAWTGQRVMSDVAVQGGYTEQETSTRADIERAYTINQWDLIDTFVYFSHHLVTIPPAQWIAVAHRNGTQASLDDLQQFLFVYNTHVSIVFVAVQFMRRDISATFQPL